jgi:hypothetical protein
MSRIRWFRAAIAAAVVTSVAAFGGTGPALAASPASADTIGKAQPVTVTKATLEEIQAIAAKGEGTPFTVDAGMGTSAAPPFISCVLTVGPPFGGGSPGASVQAGAAIQCTDYMDIMSLTIQLFREASPVATGPAVALRSPAVYATAYESTCRNGIYWAVATGYIARSGYTVVPSPWRTRNSLPSSIGCGSTPPPPPPPPAGDVTVIDPGNQVRFVGDYSTLQMSATGGSGTYVWSASGLPPGLAINPSTGLISGTVNSLGTATVTVTAVSGIGSSGFITFNWTVRREACPTC